MADPDDMGQADLEQQAQDWAALPVPMRVLRHLVAATMALRGRVQVLETDRDTARAAVVDLRARVKALEDAQPPP